MIPNLILRRIFGTRSNIFGYFSKSSIEMIDAVVIVPRELSCEHY